MGWSNSIRRRALVLRGLPPTDYPTVLVAVGFIGMVMLTLRRRGLGVATQRLRRVCPPQGPQDPRRDALQGSRRVAHAVDVAAQLVPLWVGCLPRALVTEALLRHDGIEAAVRIGVRHDAAGFAAHAWVEVDGMPINDSVEIVSQYVAFDEPVSAAIVAAMR